MGRNASRLLRVNITEQEQRNIRALAAVHGEGVQEFIARALRRSPVTRAAFTGSTSGKGQHG